jgi:hypothetical protein
MANTNVQVKQFNVLQAFFSANKFWVTITQMEKVKQCLDEGAQAKNLPFERRGVTMFDG